MAGVVVALSTVRPPTSTVAWSVQPAGLVATQWTASSSVAVSVPETVGSATSSRVPPALAPRVPRSQLIDPVSPTSGAAAGAREVET